MKPFVIALLALSFLSACSEDPQVVHQVVKGFTPQQTESFEIERFFIGQISASQQTNLSFETPGKVEKLFVDQGEKVAKGDLLAKLDASLLKTQSKELSAELQDIQARKTLAENNLRRQRNLRVSGFSAEQRIDELSSEVQSLIAVGQRIKASLNANVIRIKKATLNAPFDGVVSRRFIDAGMVVDPSRPVFQIIDEGGLELKVGVPAGLISALVEGQSYQAEIDGLETQAVFISASAHIDQTTQTVPVRFALTGVSARDGQVGVVSVKKEQMSTGFWVPISSVSEGMRGSWVVYGLKAVAENSKLRVLQQNAVEILHVNDDFFYVKADFTGDIVASGMHKVVPGQTVELVVNVMEDTAAETVLSVSEGELEETLKPDESNDSVEQPTSVTPVKTESQSAVVAS